MTTMDTPRTRQLLRDRFHHKQRVKAIEDELRSHGICFDSLKKSRRTAQPLTDRQAKLLAFMKAYQHENGRPPLGHEMIEHMQVKYTSSVTSLIEALRKRGLIYHNGHQSRCWAVKED